MTMPKIETSKMSAEAAEYATAISNKGTLRASKPKDGKAAYVWRMVAFQVSTNPKHHCMPVCADFDIDAKYDERKAITKALDVIVDEIVNSIPKEQWHGIRRWGMAYGMIGTPRATSTGEIIYR